MYKMVIFRPSIYFFHQFTCSVDLNLDKKSKSLEKKNGWVISGCVFFVSILIRRSDGEFFFNFFRPIRMPNCVFKCPTDYTGFMHHLYLYILVRGLTPKILGIKDDLQSKLYAKVMET